MFEEEFNKLVRQDQQAFAQITNKILIKGFIVRDVFDTREKIIRVNPDYRFIERFYELIEDYLEFSGWHIEKDSMNGVIALSNNFEDNRLRIDRETSLILFALRLIYENEKETSSQSQIAIFLTTASLISMMLEHGITMPGKRITGRGVSKALRFLASHNIISKVSGSYDEGNVAFYILPSVIYAIDNDKIVAMSKIIDELKGSEEQTDLGGALDETIN
ncbi:MAG TPA: DUF4194 domain-containing protein [Candidatus Onthovivens sp.]|nr:DUF4194 domain-containing protein [Candidatus Onthovivens sp.]